MRLSINSVGKYELRAVLARTPLSTVYDGWDSDIARRVAIKMIPIAVNEDSDAAEALARFKRGAQAAGKLNHPNIVAVHDYGETEGYAYLVMEFVDGPTLKQKFDDNQRFGLSDIHDIIGCVLDALQYSHDRGVVHRDIKPANIMFTKDNKVKITDFGIARIEDSEMTQAGMVIGTPAYMSPEQFLGEKIDARTDIYSTAVVLYQILTGERPYEGNLATIMHKVLYGSPPVPSRISTLVTPSLDKLITRAMARNREDRFSTAAELSAALQATRAPAAPRVERPVAPSAKRPGVPGALRQLPPKSVLTAKPYGLVLASIAALTVAAVGVATWFLYPSEPPPARVAASSQTVPSPPGNAPAPAKDLPRPSQNDTSSVVVPSDTTQLPPRPETAPVDQQDRVKAAINNFVQRPEPAVDPTNNPPPFGSEISPRPPIAATQQQITSPQREPANPQPARKPAPNPAAANQLGPAYVSPDRREPRPAKPLQENGDKTAALSDPRAPLGSDSSEAMHRLRKDLDTQTAPPVVARPAPTYAATSSSPVGLLCQTVTAETAGGFGLDTPQGIVVTGVVVGSPAYKAGIQTNDVILKIKGKDAYDLSLLSQAAAESGPGQPVPVEILRRRNRQVVQLQVDRRP